MTVKPQKVMARVLDRK